uniref:Uncharacterized protein n=1 Tax=Zymomonas mobilis subsp. mobilis str. CP4 = NRRL B-14023 TaxID=627343 RepID=B3GN87_ZYMMB|nr:hypothetical protein [Zymomonas mobilis subsp. mobilis str. CP4 = NRRL B-14023]
MKYGRKSLMHIYAALSIGSFPCFPVKIPLVSQKLCPLFYPRDWASVSYGQRS